MRLLHVQSNPKVITWRSALYSFSTSVKITLTNLAFSTNLVGISKKDSLHNARAVHHLINLLTINPIAARSTATTISFSDFSGLAISSAVVMFSLVLSANRISVKALFRL